MLGYLSRAISRLLDKRVIASYVEAGLAYGSEAPEVGYSEKSMHSLNRLVETESTYIEKGFQPVTVDTFKAAAKGKDISRFIGIKRRHGELPRPYAFDHRSAHLEFTVSYADFDSFPYQ